MAKHSIDVVLQELTKATVNPKKFLKQVLWIVLSFVVWFINCVFRSPDNNFDGFKKLLKLTYDYTKHEEKALVVSDALPELIIDNFDLEQIWQQVELQNKGVLDKSVFAVSKILARKDKLLSNTINKSDKNDSNAQEDLESSTDGSDSDVANDKSSALEDSQNESVASDDDSFAEEEVSKENKSNQRSSVVDDDFFKLQEMENFLNVEESNLTNKNNEKDSGNSSESDSEDIDLFEKQSDDDENEKNPKYKDFFMEEKLQSKKPKRNKFFEQEELEESGDEIKSLLQLRNERLKKKIEDLEEQALSEKPWQLKGEITADSRPQNSLLEEIVEFDLTSRPGKYALYTVLIYFYLTSQIPYVFVSRL